jgi:hypothetical protein
MPFLFISIFIFVGQASAELASRRWNHLWTVSMQTQNRLHEIHQEIRGIELDSSRWDRDITYYEPRVIECEKSASTHKCRKDLEDWKKQLKTARENYAEKTRDIVKLEDEYNDKLRAEHARIDKEAAEKAEKKKETQAPAPVEERTPVPVGTSEGEVPPYQADRTHVDTVALMNQVRNDANDLGDKIQRAENKADDFEDRLDQQEMGLYLKAKLERMLKDGQMCDKVVKQCTNGVAPNESSIKSFMDSIFKSDEKVKTYPVSRSTGAK